MDGDDCMGEGGFQGCDYEGTSCSCQGGGGGNQTWSCEAALVCPDTQPANGDACTGGGGFGDNCQYGDAVCFCGGNDEWNCFGGGDGGFQFP
jgi:hypothetical protein